MTIEEGLVIKMKIFRWFQKNRKWIFFAMLAETFVFAWGMLLWEIPNDINVTSKQDICIGSKIPVSYERGSEEEVFASTGKDVYQVTCKFLGVIPIK